MLSIMNFYIQRCYCSCFYTLHFNEIECSKPIPSPFQLSPRFSSFSVILFFCCAVRWRREKVLALFHNCWRHNIFTNSIVYWWQSECGCALSSGEIFSEPKMHHAEQETSKWKVASAKKDIPCSFSSIVCVSLFWSDNIESWETSLYVHYFSFLILTFKLKEHHLLTLPVTCHHVTSIIHFLLSKKAQTAIFGQEVHV